jgi:hypothetical protein
MCHHTLGTEPEAWRHEQDDEESEADETSEDPSFANEDSDVDVALLDADD